MGVTCDSIPSWNSWEQRADGAEDDMAEARDPAIKLFGATIPVASAAAPPRAEETEVAEAAEVEAAAPAEGQKETPKEAKDVEVSDANLATELGEVNEAAPMISSSLASSNEDDEKSTTADEPAKSKGEEAKTETESSAPEKLKKPDKILPCPRCNSMETKFCYYNNYNINQPRHFCKNCQRYWTAGGTMRNVPVGAGRRKSKQHSTAQCRSIVFPSEGLQPPQLDTLNLTHHRVLPGSPSISPRPLMGNGTILKFGQEVPLSESMASVLSIRDQAPNADSGGGTAGRRESKEEPSCASAAIAGEDSGSAKNAVRAKQSGTQVCSNGVVTPIPPPFQCYPGAPWAYPWSATWNSAAAVEASKCSFGNTSSVSWSPTAMMAAAPPFCAATLPFPFVPAPFWGFAAAAAWPNGAWNLPLAGSKGCISPSSSTSNSGCSGSSSPTLGKHSRDSALPTEEKAEKSLWAPKTLRIDDPEEAAKSSIWGTLGIKPDIGGVSIFQSKAENKAHKSDAAQVLQANPAALSRSLSFQETT